MKKIQLITIIAYIINSSMSFAKTNSYQSLENNIDKLKNHYTNIIHSHITAKNINQLEINISPLKQSTSKALTSLKQLELIEVNGFSKDAWQVNTASIESLKSATEEVTITITTKADVKELTKQQKSALFNSLDLVHHRDMLVIQPAKTFINKSLLPNLIAISVIFSVLCIFILIISKRQTNTLVRTLLQSQHVKKAPFTTPRPTDQTPLTHLLKERDQHLEILNKTGASFSIEQINFIYENSQSRPFIVGSALALLSHEKRCELFQSFPPGEWTNIFNTYPFFSHETNTFIKKLAQMQRDSDPTTNSLLIAIWRLQKQCGKFLHSLDKNAALFVLSKMPYNFGANIIETYFQSEWNDVLNSKFIIQPLNDDKIYEIINQAHKLHPVASTDSLRAFAINPEMVRFLDYSTSAAEKDTYQHANIGSSLLNVRPPFFPALQQSDKSTQKLLNAIGIKQLALAMSQEPEEVKSSFMTKLTPKQNAVFTSELNLVQSKPDILEEAKLARQIIAMKLTDLVNHD